MNPMPLSEQIDHFMPAWMEMDWPLDWGGVFEGPSRPLLLEVGFGDGEYLGHLSRRHADCNVAGIELAWESIQNAFRRFEREDMPGLRVFKGDAWLFLGDVFPKGSIDEIHINCPDPWPKERHVRRRLLQPAFVEMLAGALRPEGMLRIATDHAALADWMEGVLEAQSWFESIHPTSRVHELPDRIATKYERKYREAGAPVHYFEWRRVDAPAAPQTERRILEMPNVTLDGPIELDTLMNDFAPHAHRERDEGIDVVVHLRRIYRATQTAPDQETARDGHEKLHWAVEAFVQEGRLAQCFAVGLTMHGAKLTVRPSPLGFPRPTFGVKRAVRLVVERLLAAAPDLRVGSSTIGSFGAHGPPAA